MGSQRGLRALPALPAVGRAVGAAVDAPRDRIEIARVGKV
jgi:hypothetical protein